MFFIYIRVRICPMEGLNVLAGARPASMAAKKDPVESLRSE